MASAKPKLTVTETNAKTEAYSNWG